MTAQSRATDQLTTRQVQILQLVAQGLGDREIGRIVHLSENTVGTHIGDVRRNLGAVNRAHAVHLGHRLGILGDLAEVRAELAKAYDHSCGCISGPLIFPPKADEANQGAP